MKSTRSLSWISSLLGAGARRVPPHVFELSRRALRYARFEPSDGRLELAAFQEVGLPTELVQEGPLGGALREAESFRRLLTELLEAAGASMEHASLILPDSWLRTLVVDMEGADAVGSQEDFLRWRLKKLVPFRVEGLRVRAVADGVGRDGKGSRMLVGFAVEQLLSELEAAFRQHGIRLGLITNRSLPIARALTDSSELRCVALLSEDGYSLVFVLEGRAVLSRYKALDPTALGDGIEAAVRRDLRITRAYLEEEIPDHALVRGLVCGPESVESQWTELLQDCLGVPAVQLDEGDLRPASPSGRPWHLLAPLLGAAETEVA